MSKLVIDLNSPSDELLRYADFLNDLADRETVKLTPLTAADIIPETTPAAAIVPETTPAAAPAAGELDVKGHPWDERIHAGTKTKNADGSWKLRRGVDKNLVAQIQAELTTDQGGSPFPPFNSETAQPTVQPAQPLTWAEVLQRVTVATQKNAIDIAAMNDWLAQRSVANGISMLVTRPDLFQEFVDVFHI